MSEELVKIGTQDLAVGGVGVDFSSPLFALKPATLTINQGMTQAEGAIPGKLRVVETGEQFDFMTVALLLMPVEERQYYIGKPGELNRIPSNLMCFSRDLIRPDENSKQMQAEHCDGCSRSSWVKWNETRAKEDIPPCDHYYKALLIDTVTQTPLRMYLRSGNKKPFGEGMQQLARKIMLLKSQGLNPNIWDIVFKITTAKTKSATPNHVISVDKTSFHVASDEEKAAFGGLYLNYINRGRKSEEEAAEEEAASQIVEAETAVTAGVADETIVDGEIII